MRYAFLNQKGGCGKTTLTVNLAVTLADQGRRVLLVDADQQQSAQDWAAARAARDDAAGLSRVSVIGAPRNTLHKEIAELSRGYDDVIIDGPARVAGVTRAALVAADVVVIPVQPSPFDIWASNEIQQTIEDAIEEIDARFLINRRAAGTKLGKEVRAALDELPIPVLETSIGQRTVFGKAAAVGLAAREVPAGGDPIAAQEIEELASELAS